MTGYYQIAKLIPADIRRSILLDNDIYSCVCDANNIHMKALFVVYAAYIEPNNPTYEYEMKGDDITIVNACQLCLTNILDKFKLLEPYLILLEKESNLIEA